MLTYILITERCNLNCAHCIRGTHSATDITMGGFSRAVEQIRDVFPSSGLVLSGGEPTLHLDFAMMLRKALCAGFRSVIVNTNGTTDFFDDPSPYREFPNLHIQFSIDGDRKSHDAIRGRGTFDRVLKRMEILRSIGLPIWVSTVVTAGNVDSICDLRDLMVECGVEKWHVNPLLPFGCGSGLEPIPIERWNDLVDVLIDTTALRLGIHKLYDFAALDRLDEKQIGRIVRDVAANRTCNCGCGNQKLYIYPDLTVYGCTCIKNYPFGSLSEQSLHDVIESPTAKMIRNYELAPESACRKCRYVSICNGGCVGMSEHVFGRLGVGDPRCPEFRKLSL